MLDYLIIIILILFSALFSGLTLGLMSLNVSELKRKASLGNNNALKVYKIRIQGNLLLTTLLIGNVAINSTLAIFLGSIESGLVATLIATGLIVIFGEIMPQAIFSRFALYLGAKMELLVKIFIFILYPISYPIALLLDKILGEELTTVYSRRELMKIIEEHGMAKESDIDTDEERIIMGALTFSEKSVKDIMTPKSVITALEFSQRIDNDLMNRLKKQSHSRIPIYRDKLDNIVGMLYILQLIGEKHMGKTVGQIADKKVFFVDKNKKLDTVFKTFLKKRHHLFLVKNIRDKIVGVITLEDILEEIIKSEIVDEVDKYEDLRKLAKKKIKFSKKN